MIGDKHLDIDQETNGNAGAEPAGVEHRIRARLRGVFHREQALPLRTTTYPFLKAGIPAIDLIDFDYEPWHTDEDTMDKLSAQSLEIVGTVVLDVIQKLERQ